MDTDATVLSHLAGKFTIQPENLATEALAFILRRSVAARVAIRTMAAHFGCPCPDDLTFETQISNYDGARPDVIGKFPDGNVRLLIEAKFWAGLTEAQPVSYLEKSLPSEGGLLLFVAPEKRLHNLCSELSRRVVAAGYPREHPTTPGPNRWCIRVGSNILALTSWRVFLETIIGQVDQAGDLKCMGDLKQLAGLCDQMDADAFLPLTSEEMTSTLGQRIVQFCDLANVLTEQLVSIGHGNVSGLKATGGHGWYGRYLHLKGQGAVRGYGAVIQFSAWNWSKWSESPLWLGIRGEDWRPSAKVRDALVRSSIDFQEGDSYCFVPIRLPLGAEREEVIADGLAQILRVIDALPPPASMAMTATTPLKLMQVSGDESVRETLGATLDVTLR